MDGSRGEGTALNSFALVAYLPDPLVGFIDRLRQEIEPGCHLRAHLTFLPPRPISVTRDQIDQQLAHGLRNCPPFQVHLEQVQIFSESQVIHLAVGSGFRDAQHIHDILNQGPLAFKESFYYHPHVTLAQHLAPEHVNAATELAKQRWNEYSGDRFFLTDHLTLVQNVGVDSWKNLQDFPLGATVAV